MDPRIQKLFKFFARAMDDDMIHENLDMNRPYYIVPLSDTIKKIDKYNSLQGTMN